MSRAVVCQGIVLEMQVRRLLFAVLSALFLCPGFSAASDPVSFEGCVTSLGERAQLAGVDTALIQRVLPELAPLERVLELDAKQPEFVQTFGEYVHGRVTPGRVERGRALLKKYQTFFQELSQRYGVPPRYLVAFWGLETNYGSYLGNVPTLNALATLACDPRRSEFFAAQFVNALQIMQREALSQETLRGSWAGAVGHTQFMPSSYLRYAVDGDGDGSVDLWSSERDALASGANFLRSLGWTPELRWGRPVVLPADFPYELASLGEARSLHAWASLGVRQLDGATVPALDVDASLLLPAGYLGPAFLVYENFRVIMRWNHSQSYALSVGLLADRLAGAGPQLLPEETSARLLSSKIEDAQRALNALGHDAGEADGVLGSRTRAALRAFQLDHGLPADGYPNATTLETLGAVALP
ncbi:lytic murein transglycosylase [Congregibacter variabilis]|uniref:Lytic murein transglycosylase n=1 Tax=Congregibacter variabilis TaxID=3081200 RepID=A0ABZ0I3E2_9GAMM|nr:lytic murein transglycosylase [Congregibacter sp. IMCC43200]